MTSKARRRSKRSSSSSGSSSESSSESDSSIQSSGSDEWVESTAVSRNETEKQGSHSKRGYKNRSSRESPAHTATLHKETKPRRKRTESSPENDDKKADSRSPKCRRGRGNHVKRKMKRSSSSRSSSSRSPSGDRERERGEERGRGKRSRERDGHDIVRSPKKRKTSESESFRRLGEGVCKREQSSQKGSDAVSSVHEQSLVGMIKRIRESSGKDHELRQTSAEYCAGETGLGCDRKVDNGSDSRSLKQSHKREIERPGARKFRESFISKVQYSEGAFVSNSKAGYSEDGRVRETSKSLKSREQRSESSRDRKPSLVSYVTSSDEEKS